LIGVLAFQGSFEKHLHVLAQLHVQARPVRSPAELHGVSHLVLPGGESTVLSHFLETEGLADVIRDRADSGQLAVFGTCAGAILLGHAPAEERPGPRQPVRLGLADVVVSRNAYGRQIDSFCAPLELLGPLAAQQPLEGVFIRAPGFERVSEAAEVLARHDGEPVLVRDGRLLLASFHPELTNDLRLHQFFVDEM
jgi:5'-phosphate synthase pdxT subunit